MHIEEIERLHRQDMMIKWAMYAVSFALGAVIIGVFVRLNHIKQEHLSQATTETAAVGNEIKNSTELSSRAPSDVGQAELGQLRSDLFRLQEQNSQLRAALIQTQQRIAALESGRSLPSSKPLARVNAPRFSKKPTALRASPVRKLGQVKKTKKKPKVIQVSFESHKDRK